MNADLNTLKKAADDAAAAYVAALRLEMAQYETPTPVNVPTVAPMTTTATTATTPKRPVTNTLGGRNEMGNDQIRERVRQSLANDWQGVRGIASALSLFNRLKDVKRACDGLVLAGAAEYQPNGANPKYRLKQAAPVTNANSDGGVTAGSL